MNEPGTGTRFQRFLLPGLAFKAAVIGGGYATGREIAEFFLPAGPQGGLLGMLLAMCFWSIVCALAFAFALQALAFDYRSFFKELLGPAWIAFEVAYALFAILVLAVFGAAAGAIASAVLGWTPQTGTLCLAAAICAFAAAGNAAVERLFKWVSIFLYGVYGAFVALTLIRFGPLIGAQLGHVRPTGGWWSGGLTYASYNVVGAIVVLPMLKHLRTRRDALIAGALAGPLAMLPALLFFVCMLAFYPQIAREALPSDYILRRLDAPLFHELFEAMIFLALLESGTGFVHAINERVALVYRLRRGHALPRLGRLVITGTILIGAMFLAQRFGLVTLIAQGYRGLAYVILGVFVLPLVTFGLARLWRTRAG